MLQANLEAKQFRYGGLQYANELKSLFEGVRATGNFSWGPSKEGLPTDGVGSRPGTCINLDSESLEMPSPKDLLNNYLQLLKHYKILKGQVLKNATAFWMRCSFLK